MPFTSMQEIIDANYNRGSHFFSTDTMRGFRSRISWESFTEPRWFITSERAPGGPRRYTIRHAGDNGNISTVGEFQEYGSLVAAKAQLREIVAGRGPIPEVR